MTIHVSLSQNVIQMATTLIMILIRV